MKSRAWRVPAVVVAVAATVSCGLAGTVAHADEPAPPPETPESTVPTGEVDGAVVAVGLPPVPPTTVEVMVEVAVDEPPVPPTSVVVAVDVPPVPPVTVPDAGPIVASHAVAPAGAPQQIESEPDPQLPATGAAAARATAIVAGAAVSIGAALRALANRP
jgi:hypothetical protein